MGDLPYEDSRISKALMKAANVVREGFQFGHNRFPPSFPARDILNSINEYSPNPKNDLWLCQVFLNGKRYLGYLEREICFFGEVEEVVDAMSDKKMMQIRIEGDLHKWLKLYAAKNDITMTDIIIQYLEYLRRKSAKAVSVEQI